MKRLQTLRVKQGYMNSVRKRKGLAVDEKIFEHKELEKKHQVMHLGGDRLYYFSS